MLGLLPDPLPLIRMIEINIIRRMALRDMVKTNYIQHRSLQGHVLEPLALRPTIILIIRYILRMLLHIFLMKSAIIGATKKDDFLKCVHFRHKRTYTGNELEFYVCFGGRGATG
jgi:hypothetical protein